MDRQRLNILEAYSLAITFFIFALVIFNTLSSSDIATRNILDLFIVTLLIYLLLYCVGMTILFSYSTINPKTLSVIKRDLTRRNVDLFGKIWRSVHYPTIIMAMPIVVLYSLISEGSRLSEGINAVIWLGLILFPVLSIASIKLWITQRKSNKNTDIPTQKQH